MTNKVQLKLIENNLNENISNKNYSKNFYPNLAFNSVPLTTYVSKNLTENQLYFEAIEILNKSLKQNPNCLYSKYLLSRNYILIEDYKNAIIILEDLFNINPNIETSAALYISLLGEMQNYTKLLNIRTQVINTNNKLIQSYFDSAMKNFKIK